MYVSFTRQAANSDEGEAKRSLGIEFHCLARLKKASESRSPWNKLKHRMRLEDNYTVGMKLR